MLLLLLINFRVIGHMISIESLENPGAVKASEIIAEDGTVLGKYHEVNYPYVEYNAISKNVIDACIAIEDEDFYNHAGITVNDMEQLPFYLVEGIVKKGGTTITQKLARRLLLNNGNTYTDTNIFERTFQKMQEWLLTVKLERNFTKQEIITLYLNTALFGNYTYGIQNAAHTFFSKDADLLSLEEAACIIGMLKGRNLYNPLQNPHISLARRNIVIEMMEKYEFIARTTAKEARNNPIVLRCSSISYDNGPVPYFRDVLREELETWCKDHKKADGSAYNLYQDGLKIYTRINPRMRLYVEEVVSRQQQQLQQTLAQRSNIKSDSIWNKWPQFPDNFIKESVRYKHMKDNDATGDKAKILMRTTSTSGDSISKPVYIIRIKNRYGVSL